MTKAQALAALKKAGTAQNVKVYGRHGVTGAMFGVSYAELGKLQKAIGTDHALACALWETGNHDARVLATMIADPGALGSRDLDAWAREIDNYVLCDAFSALVARTGDGLRKYGAWKNRKSEFTSAAAYNVLAAVACYRDGADIDPAFARAEIDEIAATIHDRPNRTRHSMNQALVSLGAIDAKLAQHAKAAAKRMGRIAVDHGQTSCRTPDAATYIDQTRAHREKKAAKAAAKKKARG